MIKVEEIYQVTDSGLDIIRSYYPDAEPGKAFKMRDESTASCRLKLYKDVWKAIDFGDDGHPLSPVDIVMREEKMTFGEAVCHLAAKYNLSSEVSFTKNIPDIKQRDPQDDEKDGQYDYELKEEFTSEELKLIGPNVTNEHCKALGYHSVKWYSVVKAASDKDAKKKSRRVTILGSNENYPIFLRNCGEFQKVYQPLNPDKAFRFFYIGKKERSFINGLEELKKAFRDYNEAQEKEWYKDPMNEDKPYKEVKYPEVVICSGERDALNCKSFGYQPIWFNSETYDLSEKEYKEISHYAEKIYNIPDIDATGKIKACELALKFMDIHTVWLPEWIKNFKDNRGKPRKDLRDFVELRPSITDFKNLLNVSMPGTFWEYKPSQFGLRLELNSEFLIHFLRLSGFYKMRFAASKEGKILVHIKNGIVNQVDANDIRDYIKNFLRERYYPVSILNLVNNSKRVGDDAMKGLNMVDLDFDDFDGGFQYMFFGNTAVKITAQEIKTEKYKGLLKSVWEPLVLKHDFKRLDPSFTTTWIPEKNSYDIQVNHKMSKFFCFLINSSRMHWRKELEGSLADLPADQTEAYRKEHKFDIAGPNLSEMDQEEQKLHLINKIFSIGYLLHSWKAKHRAWCVFAMDNRISEEGASNGRSGKSFCFMSLENFKVTAYIAGRNEKLQENKHLFEEVNELTRLLIVNDAHKYFPMNLFFDIVTEKLAVNPKFGKQFTLSFEQAPKMVLTTNFASRNLDDSTQARLLYTVFSDYYHQKTDNNDFLETRRIYDDFDKQLQYDDYSKEEWNADFNFYAECLQFYISTIGPNRKIDPPMDSVTMRNLREGIGDAFKDWADRYFLPDGERVNTNLIRAEVMEDYLKTNRKDSAQNFSRKLAMWCKYSNYVKDLNPKAYHTTKDGRILKKIDGKTHEMIYIQTIDNKLDPFQVTTEPDEENMPF